MPIESDCYWKSGRILYEALKAGAAMVQEGKLYIEVAEAIESIIWNQAAPAFPVNISVNEVAAHYTPAVNDKHRFRNGDVVKIDAGVQVDGHIADSACTIVVGNNKQHIEMVLAVEEALGKAINIVKAGTRVSDIGKTIEATITAYGFKPITNLQGHSLERFNLHAGLSIPNVATSSRRKLKVGEVIAIEPFATTGTGSVVNGAAGNIYHLTSRGQGAVIKAIRQQFGTLPFASRWLTQIVTAERVQTTIQFLLRRRYIQCYNVLLESGGGIVTQKEHTMIVAADGCEVITAPER